MCTHSSVQSAMRFTYSPGRFCRDDDTDNVFTYLRSALRAETSSFVTSMTTMMTVMTRMVMTTMTVMMMTVMICTCLRCALRVLHKNDYDDNDEKDYGDDENDYLHLFEVRSHYTS